MTPAEREEASRLGCDCYDCLRGERDLAEVARLYQRRAQRSYEQLQRMRWAAEENEWLAERLWSHQKDSAEDYRLARLAYDYWLEQIS